MRKIRPIIITASLLLAAPSMNLLAQGRPGAQNHPPVINSDGSVTFVIDQPNAKEVRFFGDFGGGGKMPLMQKTDEKAWTITITPEEPGTYHYSFLVDGVLTPDPSNFNARDWRSFLPWVNIIDLRGKEPFLHDPNPDIPHGQIRAEQLKSTVLKKSVPLWIYTPAGYETSQKAYPVIFVMHGSDGIAAQWSSDGRIEHLADNLIAAGRMPEAIIVSPDMNMPAAGFYAATETYMVNEVLPFVEAKYRVITEAWARSVVGTSRGGNQAFHVVFKRPDLFTALGVFSINLGILTSQQYDSLKDVAKVNQQLRTFTYAGGMDDSLIPFNTVQAAHDRMLQMGIAHAFTPVAGDHSWHNWRKLFADFAGKL